jgi:hypothetical protein
MNDLELYWALASTPALKEEVIQKAQSEGREEQLPEAARNYLSDRVMLAAVTMMIQKAKGEDLADLFRMSFDHHGFQGDTHGQRRLVRFAEERGILHHLPHEAHGLMHDMGVSHNHEGITNDENGLHQHMIAKAFPGQMLMKAVADGDDLIVEGWVSTPAEDLQRDIVLPEAFIKAMDGYATTGMPLTTEHELYPNGKQLKRYPVGHGQRVAVIKAGEIVKSVTHPDDAAEFEYFPNAGDGVWGRYRVTEATAAGAVRKGNLRGFSWIGWPEDGGVQPRRPKGVIFKSIRHWAETTMAAFPVNQTAHIAAAA